MVQDLKLQIQNVTADFLVQKGVDAPVVQLERTSDAQFGEYATNVAMRYAKVLKAAPMEIAQELVAYLHQAGIQGVDRVECVPPGFVNIYLSERAFVEQVTAVLAQGVDFGRGQSHQGEKWVIEHTSPNPNKAMHLGHLRNNLVGMGLVRLLTWAGAEVVSDCVYNDRGIAIAKMMYGFLAHMRKSTDTPVDIAQFVAQPNEWLTPAEAELTPDAFVERCYVLAEKDFKAEPAIEAQVRQLVLDWEAKDPHVWSLWQHVLQYAYEGQARTLTRLGSHWDKVWYEHEHYEAGKQYVTQGLQAGVFQQLEDGAILTNLESDYQLPDTILLKSDGTSLYITQDIALTDLKKRSYDADKLVWVVGSEQSMSFKQLFAACEQLGIGQRSDFSHVSYGYVGLKSAEKGAFKMSSRAGTVVLIDDVIDGVKQTILERLQADEKVADEALAETLALGAVKFAFLKSDRTQDITFDVEQSVDVQGDSGMYVLYTFVRTQSILKKAGDQPLAEFVPTEAGFEAPLVRSLLYFEEVIQKSVDDLSVHHVAQYLLELSAEFNRWYAKDMVLDGSASQDYKLAITQAVGSTLQNGLRLLGIATVDQM